MAKQADLYIIHGWTYTTDPWAKTLDLLKKEGLKVEMLHAPGLTSPSKKAWTIDEYAHWADRNIPDGAVALGHSNGGRILLNLCSEKPSKLKHLILLDSAGIYESSSKRDVSRTLSKKLSFLKKVPGLTKLWHKLTGASDYARAPENMKQTLSNMLESDKKLNLSRVIVPTSILWGEADTVTPPRQAHELNAKLKNSDLDIYPDWTHAPYISHPAELAKAIVRALKHPPEFIYGAEVTQAAEVSASMAIKKPEKQKVPGTKHLSATLSLKKANGPSAEDAVSRSASLSVRSTKPRKGVLPPPPAPAKEKPEVAVQESPKEPPVLSSTASKKVETKESTRKTVKGSSKPATSESFFKPAEPKVAITEEIDFEKIELEIPERKIISTASVPKVSKKEKVRRALKESSEKIKAKTARKSAKRSTKKPAKTSDTAKPTEQKGKKK